MIPQRNRQGTSIFLRILVVFMAVNAGTSAILIVIAYLFNSDIIAKRTRESVVQQVAVIGDNFQKQYGEALRNTIQSLAESSPLEEYLMAPHDEKLIIVQKVERLFIRTIRNSPSLSSILFVNSKGDVAAQVRGTTRYGESLNLKETIKGAAASGPPESLRVSAKIFRQLETTPLVLSSGYMDYFIPPREATLEGPFLDENGNLSVMAGIGKLDPEAYSFGGVILVRQNLKDFFKYLRGVKFFDENPVWVFDGNGRVLQKPTRTGTTFDPGAGLSPEFQGAVRLVDMKEGLLAYQDVSVLPDKSFIRIAVSIPTALLTKDFQAAIKFFSIVMVVSLAAVLLVALYVSRYLSKPIVELSSAAARFAAGDLSAQVELKTTGEVRTLVESFNHMTAQLRAAISSRDSSMEELVKEVGERKRIELDLMRQAQDLKDARAVSESASCAKSEFLANMSHELRTPLNHIIGFTEMIVDELFGHLNEAQKEHLVDVLNSSRHLLTLINDILDLSKVEAGKLELKVAGLHLGNLLEESTRMVKEKSLKNRIQLSTNTDDLPDVIQADERMLKQILYNLLSNAMKFTLEGGSVILFARHLSFRDGQCMTHQGQAVTLPFDKEDLVTNGKGLINISVQDTGIGISEVDLKRIFNPFEQGDSSASRQFQGTGLGLSLTKRLVELHGGRIWAESEGMGKGSKFSFVIPE